MFGEDTVCLNYTKSFRERGEGTAYESILQN